MYNINTLKQELSLAKAYEHKLLDKRSVVDRHRCHLAAKFDVCVDEDHCKLHTFFWLPKLHKRPYKSRCNEKHAFSLLNKLEDITCGHVRNCVMLSIIFWTI